MLRWVRMPIQLVPSVAGVVRMAGQDGQGAVDLLGQNDAGELVRQRNTPQGKKKVGPLSCCRRPSIRRPDGEHKPLNPIIPQAPELYRKLL